jgi:hypothetical protein
MRGIRAFTTRHSAIETEPAAAAEQTRPTDAELVRVIDLVLEEGRFYTMAAQDAARGLSVLRDRLATTNNQPIGT